MRLLLCLLAPAMALLWAGCAQDEKNDPQNPRVSTIPFNRPERWESQGQFGGMMPGSR